MKAIIIQVVYLLILIGVLFLSVSMFNPADEIKTRSFLMLFMGWTVVFGLFSRKTIIFTGTKKELILLVVSGGILTFLLPIIANVSFDY